MSNLYNIILQLISILFRLWLFNNAKDFIMSIIKQFLNIIVKEIQTTMQSLKIFSILYKLRTSIIQFPGNFQAE